MDIRDMRTTLMARYEPTAKLAREIEARGIEEIFSSIPFSERPNLSQIYQSLKDCGGESYLLQKTLDGL